jgi:hypothetical protein
MERKRGENKGERHTQKQHLCRKLREKPRKKNIGCTEKDDRSYHEDEKSWWLKTNHTLKECE